MYNSSGNQLVADASAILAIIMNESSKEVIINASIDSSLIAPGSLPWEVGNALSAMFKRKRITLEQAIDALIRFDEIPVRLVDVDLEQALELAQELNIYAYDAYMLVCALEYSAPLLALDAQLVKHAKSKGILALEV